jgi:peptidoglycan/xylan/chitin deacetylase (PgdA/CDA1 family)
MENELYDYSPIVSRPRLEWPGGARVAFYIGLNIEHYRLDAPSTSIAPVTAGLVPDPMNYGWRDYSPRVGVWRLIELLDELDLRASVLLNSEVCKRYPQIVEAGNERGWAWLAHGQDNSTLQASLAPEAEPGYLREMVAVLEASTGRRPRGWLGPALTETLQTPHLLRELGFTYLLDWCSDDQPYPLTIPGMISVPYTVELNDVTLFVGRNLSGEDYERLVADQLEQLLIDGETTGRVMALSLHPFIVNQPFRHKYLGRALRRIVETEGVWVTTSDEIAEHYIANYLP